jgi:RHH-type proline utilization regulon transcriptional repressor/proline dehydrogenase/delta 1-pyrroline-5-carboxylate dehydrogenase
MIDFTHAAETDFSQAAYREKMVGALKYVRGEFGHEYPLWIDNQPVHTPQHAESRNPAAPDEVIARSALADATHVQQALAAAQRAWRDWHRLSAAERAAPLRKAVQSITARRLELAATLVLEGGRPWREADREVARSIDLLNYYCASMEALEARPRRRDLPGESNVFSFGARGVVALAAAGDFALWQPAAAIAAALVAGNTVVFEPAAARGMTAAKLVTLLIEAGLPPGTLALLSTAGRDAAGHGLLGNGFAFDLFHDCAAPARSVNTIIVDDDADLDQAVGGVVESAFECAGQRMDRCMRVVIAAPVYNSFCQRLAETARGLLVGPPEDPATLLIGPMLDAAARERTRALIEQGRRAARVLVEFSAQQVPAAGYYVGPVIFSDVPPSSAFARQPLFGPLLLLMSAPDFESALELANDAGPALTGGVYSRSPAHIDLARREWRAANVFINRKITGFRVDVQPLGRERLGGLDYLLQFIETRSISENTLRHGLAAVESERAAGFIPAVKR